MFRKYKETDKLSIGQQKELNKKAADFLTWTVIYWLGVLVRLLMFYSQGV
jgi:hypothetical protein